MKTQFRRIAIAPNGFKGTLTSGAAADCIQRGLQRACADTSFVKIPVADGGDGTARAIMVATGGRWLRRSVSDPVGRKIRAGFALTGDGQTAVVEMAAASGLVLLSPSERNPLKTTSRGTGELIRAALGQKISRLLIGIGGTATNDGGMGLARALGVRFLDARGRDLPEGGGSLIHLAGIDCRGLDPRLREIEIQVACDVDNPLFGTKGAAHIYGPQKGASPAMVERLDAGLRQLAAIIQQDLGQKVAHLPGAGAAGGAGAGLMAFLNGQLRSGVGMVLAAVDLETKLAGCDLVITGEGRLDSQTACGKAPVGVAQMAKRLGLPVIAICGSLGPDTRQLQSLGIDACFSALAEPVDEAALRLRAPKLLEQCAEQVGRLLRLSNSSAV